jgi:hypothetical protein
MATQNTLLETITRRGLVDAMGRITNGAAVVSSRYMTVSVSEGLPADLLVKITAAYGFKVRINSTPGYAVNDHLAAGVTRAIECRYLLNTAPGNVLCININPKYVPANTSRRYVIGTDTSKDNSKWYGVKQKFLSTMPDLDMRSRLQDLDMTKKNDFGFKVNTLVCSDMSATYSLREICTFMHLQSITQTYTREMITPIMCATNKGKIPVIDYTYVIDRWNDTITYTPPSNISTGHVHKYSTTRQYAYTTPLYLFIDGRLCAYMSNVVNQLEWGVLLKISYAGARSITVPRAIKHCIPYVKITSLQVKKVRAGRVSFSPVTYVVSTEFVDRFLSFWNLNARKPNFCAADFIAIAEMAANSYKFNGISIGLDKALVPNDEDMVPIALALSLHYMSRIEHLTDVITKMQDRINVHNSVFAAPMAFVYAIIDKMSVVSKSVGMFLNKYIFDIGIWKRVSVTPLEYTGSQFYSIADYVAFANNTVVKAIDAIFVPKRKDAMIAMDDFLDSFYGPAEDVVVEEVTEEIGDLVVDYGEGTIAEDLAMLYDEDNDDIRTQVDDGDARSIDDKIVDNDSIGTSETLSSDSQLQLATSVGKDDGVYQEVGSFKFEGGRRAREYTDADILKLFKTVKADYDILQQAIEKQLKGNLRNEANMSSLKNNSVYLRASTYLFTVSAGVTLYQTDNRSGKNYFPKDVHDDFVSRAQVNKEGRRISDRFRCNIMVLVTVSNMANKGEFIHIVGGNFVTKELYYEDSLSGIIICNDDTLRDFSALERELIDKMDTADENAIVRGYRALALTRGIPGIGKSYDIVTTARPGQFVLGTTKDCTEDLFKSYMRHKDIDPNRTKSIKRYIRTGGSFIFNVSPDMLTQNKLFADWNPVIATFDEAMALNIFMLWAIAIVMATASSEFRNLFLSGDEKQGDFHVDPAIVRIPDYSQHVKRFWDGIMMSKRKIITRRCPRDITWLISKMYYDDDKCTSTSSVVKSITNRISANSFVADIKPLSMDYDPNMVYIVFSNTEKSNLEAYFRSKGYNPNKVTKVGGVYTAAQIQGHTCEHVMICRVGTAAKPSMPSTDKKLQNAALTRHTKTLTYAADMVGSDVIIPILNKLVIKYLSGDEFDEQCNTDQSPLYSDNY